MLNSEIWFRNLTALDSAGEVVFPCDDSSNSIGVFNGGGLFLEDSLPASFVSSITNRRCSASSLNTVSCAARSDRGRWIGVGICRRGTGGMFLSVTLSVRGGNGGVGEDSNEILERSGENDVASEAEALREIENEKVEKPGVRSGSQQALNVTKHLWAGAVAAMVSR